MIKLIINGNQIEVEENTTVLKAARELGIEIPTFCDDDRLSKQTSCRLCIVEVEGTDKLLTSCNLEVKEGMVVNTESEKVRIALKINLSLIWAGHPNDCMKCGKSGECKLQDYSFEYDVDAEPIYSVRKEAIAKNATNHFFEIDPDKCILCGKCVRICSEQVGVGALGFKNRGQETYVSFGNDNFEDAGCVSCGSCVSVCPTGALLNKTADKYRNWDVDKVRTTCSYCGVGCQMELVVHKGKIVRVDANEEGSNRGLLCVKGKYAFNFINHRDRLTTPLVRKNGKLVEATWEEAYAKINQKYLEFKGESNSFVGFSSARCTNEENYLFQKMFRQVFKTNNIDHCARL